MSRNTLFIVVAVALLALGGYLLWSNSAVAPTSTEEEVVSGTSTTTETISETAPIPALVTYSDNGFEPARITVQPGETVRFVNNSSTRMWVGADEHPTHTSYDGTATREHCVDGAAIGGTFDQCHAADAGASWEFTFTKEGTWDYHNHARANHTGTVIVSD